MIKIEHRKERTINDYQIKDKKSTLAFVTNLIEGAVHGVSIAMVVIMTLPNARLKGGKLFPVEAIHFSIYFLMSSVSMFRHLVNG